MDMDMDIDMGANRLVSGSVLGKRKTGRYRQELAARNSLPLINHYSVPLKKQCALIDINLPADQSIIISPASPVTSSLQVPARGFIRHKSDPGLLLCKDTVDFTGIAIHKGELIEFTLSDVLNKSKKWLMMVFFPQHFAFVDAGKLAPFFNANLMSRCEVVACSCDSQYALLAWYNQALPSWGSQAGSNIFLLSDLTRDIWKLFFSKFVHNMGKPGHSNSVSIVVLDNNGLFKFAFADFYPSNPTLQELVSEISALQDR